MTTPINKVLTNQTQTLSNEELANVSASLSAILGQGGGSTYSGDGQYINVNDNTITLTQAAASMLNSVEYKLDTDAYAAASATWEDVANTYKTYSGDYLVESATSAMYYPLTGNPSGFMDEMFIAKYGETTIAELDAAYNAHQMVYCMVPTGTTGTRLAFLAFINTNNASEACYEFQYYRSTTSKSIGAQSDQVIIFSCASATSNWTSGTRNTNAQIVADTGLSAKMSGNKLYLGVSADYALKSELPVVTDMATKTWVSGQGYLTAVPDTYATKEYANEASANAYDKAIAQIPTVTGFITKDVDNLTYYYKKTETSGATELATEFAKYVIKPDTSLTDKYLVLRTNANGTVSGWCDFQDQSYSKSEANRTFVATANIDTSTLSGDGKSVSTKLGVKTDVIATKDYVNNSFLPLTGGTVTGQLVVSGGSTFDQQFLKITRDGVNGYARLGLGQYGALALKTDDSNSHTTQVNISPNASNDQLIQVQHNGNNTIGYLIPAKIEQTGWSPSTDDKILHIVLES